MDKVRLRPAVRSDAGDLAILDNLAGHGISLWFWRQDIGNGPTEVALAYGRSRFMDPEALYGWSNTTVCIDATDCVLGAVNSYVMPELDRDMADMKTDIPVFAPVFELFAAATGHWLIDSLAVFPQFQGQGIGRSLLQDSITRARKQSLKQTSLVVEDSNEKALSLYRELGYETAQVRPFVEFDGPAKTREWLLMTAEI